MGPAAQIQAFDYRNAAQSTQAGGCARCGLFQLLQGKRAAKRRHPGANLRRRFAWIRNIDVVRWLDQTGKSSRRRRTLPHDRAVRGNDKAKRAKATGKARRVESSL